MEFRRWIYYTVMVGALPMVVRFLICALMTNVSWSYAFNPIDFEFWSLTLSLSNINILGELKNNKNKQASFKTDSYWWNIVTIIFIVLIIAICNMEDMMRINILNLKAVWVATLLLSFFALFYSIYINYKLKKVMS